jgi:type IV pilus assembly protein PilB
MMEKQNLKCILRVMKDLLDEDELNAEINKSALINLVEGALVEGVRKGASDIHFIPKSGNRNRNI